MSFAQMEQEAQYIEAVRTSLLVRTCDPPTGDHQPQGQRAEEVRWMVLRLLYGHHSRCTRVLSTADGMYNSLVGVSFPFDDLARKPAVVAVHV